MRSIFTMLLGGFLLSATPLFCVAQSFATQRIYLSRQESALLILSRLDTSVSNPLWPSISAAALYHNLQENILNPERICQGHYTNFCAYAALTVLLARENPEAYARSMVDLYSTGETRIQGKQIRPAASIRKMAGTMQGKGLLNLNPADQLWFLSISDVYKGYLNIDRNFHPGDENKSWAICNIGKFNRMARALGGFTVASYGTDLFRPFGKNNAAFIREQVNKGTVVLYVNSQYLHPQKSPFFMLRTPTHYIILHDIQEKEGMVELTYWDYGFKTFQQITPKQLREMTFGIILLKAP